MLAFKNLVRSPLRTGLTVLGVALGIAMLVSVSGYGQSIGHQLQNAVTNRYQLIVQSSEVSSPLSSRITAAEVTRIEQIPGIESARPIVIGSIRTDAIPYFLLLGITSADALYGNVNLLQGSWSELQGASVMLGRNAASSIPLELGDALQLRGLSLRVSAVFGSESNILNHAAVVNLQTAQRLLGRVDTVNLVLLRTAEGQPIRPIVRQFSVALPDLQVTRSADLLGRLELFLVIDKVTTSLSLIAIVFCVLIVTNTLLMSLSERKRDIGILLAIGWSRWMIARSLLGESLLITSTGCLFGIGAGAWVLHYYSQSNIAGINWAAPVLPASIVIIALLLAVPIAFLGAIYPAILCSRWTPAEILQRE